QHGPLVRVVEVGEAGVVELQVGAPELGNGRDLLRVRGAQVVPELVHVGIDIRIERRRPAAVVHHARRRDRQLRRRGRRHGGRRPEGGTGDRLGGGGRGG